MGNKEQTSDKVQTINLNTTLQFTVRGFLILITSILSIFFGFYQLVVIPKIEVSDEYNQKMFEYQKEQNSIFYDELSKINSSISTLNGSVEAINLRFKDLNNSLQTNRNTNGSFGTSSNNNELDNSSSYYLLFNNDSSLASN